MAYRAATYGFQNQRLSEMISLVLPGLQKDKHRGTGGA